MTNKPIVSVLTPSYNKSLYVLDAIKSVVNQSLKSFEYFVIDNSTDESTRNLVSSYIKELNDDRVKLFIEDYSKEEREKYYIPSRIINKYYDMMNGEYVFYLSDDDIVDSECFEIMSNFLKEIDCDICSCWLSRERWRNGEKVQHSGDIVPGRIISIGESVDCVYDGGQIMHRLSCLKEIDKPYYPEIRDGSNHHCDGLFLNKLTKKYQIYNVKTDKPLVVHRHTESSLWTSYR